MTTHGIIKVKVFIVGVGEEGERDKQIYRERQRNNIARTEGYKAKGGKPVSWGEFRVGGVRRVRMLASMDFGMYNRYQWY